MERIVPTSPGWYFVKSLICDEIMCAYVSFALAPASAHWWEWDEFHVIPCKSPIDNPALVWLGSVPIPPTVEAK